MRRLFDQLKAREGERGAAALLTVTLASFLILILTLALVALTTGELHQATDDEDNIKAFYAAENCIQWGLEAVKHQAGLNGYASNLPQNGTTDLQSQCPDSTDATVTYSSKNPGNSGGTLALDLNTVDQYDLSTVTPGSATLTWGDSDGGTPPWLQVTMMAFAVAPGSPAPPSATIDPANTVASSLVAVPDSSGGNTASFSNWNSDLNGVANGVGSGGYQVKVNCNQSGAYPCKLTLSNLVPPDTSSGEHYVVIMRVQARQSKAIYTVQVNDASSGNPINLILNNPTIDVTTQVGQAYSRLNEEVTATNATNNLDDVLSGDTNLCKNFDRIDLGNGNVLINPHNNASDLCPLN